MTDYKELIERLNSYSAEYQQHGGVSAEAADVLTDLLAENKRLKSLLGESGQDLWSMENQRADRLEAENERLRAELEKYRKCHCVEGGCAAEKDRGTVLDGLKRVKTERDEAIKSLRVCSIEACMECQYCLYRTARSYCWDCTNGSNWKWRGSKEDEIYG